MSRDKLFQNLLNHYQVSVKEYEEFESFYNDDFSQYGNEVYSDIKTRLVHLKNYWQGELNWFNQRFNLFKEALPEFEEVIDYGFSLPYLQLTDESDRHYIYIDSEQSSIDFSKYLLSQVGKRAEFLRADIEQEEVFKDTDQISTSANRLHVSLETIEHLHYPEKFWTYLSKYFKGEDIIVSLPFGHKIPSHELIFGDADSVQAYLSEHIDIKTQNIHGPNQGSDIGHIDQFGLVVVRGTIK